MRSFPVCTKTSLSRKACVAFEKLPWNTVRKSGSKLQITLLYPVRYYTLFLELIWHTLV